MTQRPDFSGKLTHWDALTALGLFGMALAMFLSTTDIGFPRDEGFYFRYSSAYQHWFYDLEDDLGRWDGQNPSLEKSAVAPVWRGNAEHPPLAKVLFGYSWRGLGEKLRPIRSIQDAAGETLLRIGPIAKPEGFDIGEELWVLGPDLVGQKRPSSERVIARGTVLDVVGDQALARIDGDSPSAEDLNSLCAVAPDAPGPSEWLRGCQARPAARGWLSESTAFRFPAMVFGALLIAAIYLFGVGTVGRTAALFAALAFHFVPRHFFHAHLTVFDTMVTAMSFFTVAAFWYSLRSRTWVVLSGVVWGFALLTKHNAWFVPVTLGLWWLAGTKFRGGFRLPRIPWAFVAMLAIGLPMFWLFWPRLWYDGWANFKWYVAFHSNHDHYMQHYFGQVLAYPPFPWSFPFAMTAFTWPAVTVAMVALGIGGLVAAARRGHQALHRWVAPGPYAPFTVPRLLAIQALWPVVLIAIPTTPVFGGVKHWMPAMPFVALVAGVGFHIFADAALRQLARPWPRLQAARVPKIAATAALGAVLLAPAARATLHAHPDGTAYFGELIGGAPGAADAQMQRQFWGYPTRHALGYLNEHVPRNGLVYFHKSVRSAWRMYLRDGLLRADIRHTGDLFDFGSIESKLKRTTHAVYHHQKDHDEYELAVWRAYGTQTPVWQAVYDGVPMVSVYENPAKRTRAGRGR